MPGIMLKAGNKRSQLSRSSKALGAGEKNTASDLFKVI